MPGSGRGVDTKSDSAFANTRYGSAVRSIGHGADGASLFRITAAARVRRSAGAYLGFAKNVRSPAPACSRPATPRMSTLPSPSRRQPRRSASSLKRNVNLSVKMKSLSRGIYRGSLEERCEMLQPQLCSDLVNLLLAFMRSERDRSTQPRQLTRRARVPLNVIETILRTASR